MKKLSGIILLPVLLSPLHAQLNEKIAAAADKIEAKCIAWRKDIHQHPELGNREFRTAKLVADHLKKLGLEVKEGVAKTGVVGILRGGNPDPVLHFVQIWMHCLLLKIQSSLMPQK